MAVARMDSSSSLPVAVMGAGAVGSYFGGMLARAGVPVTLIGRPASVEAISREGLFLDSIHFREYVKVAASADPAAVGGAAIVLFSVKTIDTDEAAGQIAPHLDTGAVVVSLQNGVDNIERMRAAGIEAIPTVVYVAAALPAPGHVKHSGRGDLVIGHSQRKEDVARVAELFTGAAVPCRVSENIESEMWVKLLFNCAGNAVTALGRASYRKATSHAEARQVMLAATAEAVAVARAAGVRLPEGDFLGAGLALAASLGDATSSMAQDIARKKRTEIDSLNGYIARRGAELGIPTPVNHTLFALVKLLEENA